MEELLYTHAKNLQLHNLIESALTRLEHNLFELMMSLPHLTEGIPLRPICTICLQNNTICVTLDQFDYHVKIDTILKHIISYTDIGDITIEQIMDAIIKELRVVIKQYFTPKE